MEFMINDPNARVDDEEDINIDLIDVKISIVKSVYDVIEQESE